MGKLQVEYKNIDEIKPYENNPRVNDKAVEVVAKSIKEYGFKNPILIDGENNIVAGHTRLKAAEEVGVTEIPTIKVDDLTEEQIRAFRIMDNKSQEYTEWDNELLKQEMNFLDEQAFDLDLTGFDPKERGFLGKQEEFEEVPDVNIEGESESSREVLIVQLETRKDSAKIKGLLSMPENRKTIRSSDFIDALENNGYQLTDNND